MKNPPRINGKTVPTRAPEPPITEAEHERRLLEIRKALHRLVVMAFSRLPLESLALFALDQPGLVAASRRESKGRSAQVILNVPDELVMSLNGEPEKRDVVVFLHLTAATVKRLVDQDVPLIELPP